MARPHSQLPLQQSRMQRAWALLLQGAADAADLGMDVWEFAVEIDRLHACGVSNNDLRRFIQEGWIEHRLEVRSVGEKRRRFRAIENLAFGKRSCFVLSAAANGEATASKKNGATHNGRINVPKASGAAGTLVPSWNAELRRLMVGEVVVKEFRQPSSRQVAVLAAFQAQGWPPRIEDPLAADSANVSGLLHFTIQNLNRNQLVRLLHFFGDGTRRGVCWRLTTE